MQCKDLYLPRVERAVIHVCVADGVAESVMGDANSSPVTPLRGIFYTNNAHEDAAVTQSQANDCD